MISFLPSHTNSGLLIVTNIDGKKYIFVDILLCVIAGRQFYEYEVEPFLKSYGFIGKPITSLPDIRYIGISAYERIKGMEKMDNPIMLEKDEVIRLCRLLFHSPSTTTSDKCEVIKVLSAIGYIYPNWIEDRDRFIELINNNEEIKSLLEESQLDSLRETTDIAIFSIKLDNLWMQSTFTSKMRSKIREIIRKQCPLLVSALKLTKCALNISFESFEKRNLDDLKDKDIKAQISKKVKSHNSSQKIKKRSSGRSGSRHVVRYIDYSGKEQSYSVCQLRLAWCRQITCLADLVSLQSESGYKYVRKRKDNNFQFVFKPNLKNNKEYISSAFEYGVQAAEHGLEMIQLFASC